MSANAASHTRSVHRRVCRPRRPTSVPASTRSVWRSRCTPRSASVTPRPGHRPADRHHPAAVAFARLGGVGTPWVRSPIPMGRGLGYSGAVRVGGAVAARRPAARHRVARVAGTVDEVLAVAADLEGHADNAAASLLGGVVATAGGRAIRVPLGFDPAVVVWIPAVTTSTDHSRNQMPAMVSARRRRAQHRPRGDARVGPGRRRHRRAARRHQRPPAPGAALRRRADVAAGARRPGSSTAHGADG